MPDLLKRIAALEKELERARAQNNVSAPIDTVTPSQLTPFWSGPLLSVSSGVPPNGVGVSSTACSQPPFYSGPPLLASSSYFTPFCATSTAQSVRGVVPPGVGIYNVNIWILPTGAAYTQPAEWNTRGAQYFGAQPGEDYSLRSPCE
ncbi:GL22932 [Drosophila persimilis]|uniref:GL22932 n=1 Tax=Drosophila persimilis TaxID=7234 RepID=B4HCQ5_DROPE|nr:GL22932 [Drosophila persimilis]